MLNLFLWSVERNSEMSAIFLPLEQLVVSVFGWLRKQQPHCRCFFTDYRKTICCLSGEQQMFKSLRTAKELFEVLQINELNCFTQQVSTFLFFFFNCIMDNVYIRFSFLKDCFANKVVKFCMKWDTSVQTHLNSSSKDIPLHLPVFIVLKKINSIIWQGRQYKNLKYYKLTLKDTLKYLSFNYLLEKVKHIWSFGSWPFVDCIVHTVLLTFCIIIVHLNGC